MNGVDGMALDVSCPPGSSDVATAMPTLNHSGSGAMLSGGGSVTGEGSDMDDGVPAGDVVDMSCSTIFNTRRAASIVGWTNEMPAAFRPHSCLPASFRAP